MFVNFTPRNDARVFEQNRAYAAVGYSLGKSSKIEIGYLHQLLRRPGSTFESNPPFQLGVLSNLGFGGK